MNPNPTVPTVPPPPPNPAKSPLGRYLLHPGALTSEVLHAIAHVLLHCAFGASVAIGVALLILVVAAFWRQQRISSRQVGGRTLRILPPPKSTLPGQKSSGRTSWRCCDRHGAGSYQANHMSPSSSWRPRPGSTSASSSPPEYPQASSNRPPRPLGRGHGRRPRRHCRPFPAMYQSPAASCAWQRRTGTRSARTSRSTRSARSSARWGASGRARQPVSRCSRDRLRVGGSLAWRAPLAGAEPASR